MDSINALSRSRCRERRLKKHHAFSSRPAWDVWITTKLGMVIEEARTSFAPLSFSDPIGSFAARGYWKFVGKCPHQGWMLITWFPVHGPPKATKLKTWRLLIGANNTMNFVKIV